MAVVMLTVPEPVSVRSALALIVVSNGGVEGDSVPLQLTVNVFAPADAETSVGGIVSWSVEGSLALHGGIPVVGLMEPGWFDSTVPPLRESVYCMTLACAEGTTGGLL